MLRIGASQIGKCLNALFYKYTGSTYKQLEPLEQWKMKKRTELGDYGEAATIDYLKKFYFIKINNTQKNLALTVSPFEVAFDMWIDGIAVDTIEENSKFIWEGKFVSEMSSMDKQRDKYRDQITLISKAGKELLGIDTCLFTVMTRGFKLEQYIIDLNEDHYEELSNKAKLLYSYWSRNRYPADLPHSWDECGWCGYNHICKTYSSYLESLDIKKMKIDLKEIEKEIKLNERKIKKTTKILLGLMDKKVCSKVELWEKAINTKDWEFIQENLNTKKKDSKFIESYISEKEELENRNKSLNFSFTEMNTEIEADMEEEKKLQEYLEIKRAEKELENRKKKIKDYFENKMFLNDQIITKLKSKDVSISLCGNDFSNTDLSLLSEKRLKEIQCRKIEIDYNLHLLTPDELRLITKTGTKKYLRFTELKGK